MQPPADTSLGGAAMFHYTWGTVFKDSFGRKIWEFDKRTYTDEIIQRQVSNASTQVYIHHETFLAHQGLQ